MRSTSSFFSLMRRGLLSGLWVGVAAFAACTIEIQDPNQLSGDAAVDHDPDIVCPVYKVAPCAAGTYAATEKDDSGCEVPVCLSCPPVKERGCAPDQKLVYQTDDLGCQTPVCVGGSTCPPVAVLPCPSGAPLVFGVDAQGCQVAQCSSSGCDVNLVPVCPAGQHLEYVTNDTCRIPTCVPDAGCAKLWVPDADPSGVAVGCGCAAYPEKACPAGFHAATQYDAVGCPIPSCEPDATCPSDAELRYISQDESVCAMISSRCVPGEEWYFDKSCGCGCRPTQPSSGCAVGGCSGELCGEAGKELFSDCSWQDSYACYQKLGVCERQADGQCGFTMTADLKLCLSNTANTAL